jgi:putative membrane protein
MITKSLSKPFKYLFASLCVIGLSVAGLAHAAALDDAQILGIYIQVNSFDIDTALLGRANGGSEAVRKLAEHVSAAHLGVRQTAFALATQCKVTPELPTTRQAAAIEHDKVLSGLMSKSGEAFDAAYLKHEVAFHRAAIDAVKTALLPAATCPALQAHFKAVLPAFEEHLSHTEMLATQKGAK